MKKELLTAIMLMAALGIYAQAPVDTLKADTTTTRQFDLGEVSVTATRKLVKQDIDKLSYDVAHDEEAKTNNTLDMLRKVPMVTVDGEENIRVNGSTSFKIYKNGHPDPSFEGSTVSQMLKAMPASTIKRIEVITEPGARYDAEGTNSILNIVMKDNAGMEGVAGSLMFGVNHKGDLQPAATLTTQKGKLTLSATYAFVNTSKKATEANVHSETHYLGSGETIATRQFYQGPVKLHYGNLSASYELDSLNLFSLSGGGSYMMPDLLGHNHMARLGTDGSMLYSFDDVFTTPKYDNYNFNGRFDFQHKTHLNGEVLTLSYMGVATRHKQNVDQLYSNLVTPPFAYTGIRQRQHEKFYEHTAQVDYVRPLSKVHKVEVGAKYINRSNKSNTTMDYIGDEAVNMANRFNHTTQVAAAYAEWLATAGRLSMRAGLRYEFSHMKGSYPDGSATSFTKNLNDLCPSASVQYKLDVANTLSANYTTTINRPGINYLNPARVETPVTISEGAPGLSSSRNQRLSLKFTHVGKLMVTVQPGYTFSNNQIASLQGVREGKIWRSYGNVDRARDFNTMVFAQMSPWRGASLSVNGTVGYQWYRNPSLDLSLGGWHGTYTVNVQQRLPWQLVLSGGANGSFGRAPESVYELGANYQSHHVALQRSFLREGRLTVMLLAVNPFCHHLVFNTRTVQGDFTGFNRNVNNRQQFGLRLSYRFGSLKARVKTADRTIENNDVIGGIKSGGGN